MPAYPMYHNQPLRAPVTLPSNHNPSPRRDSHSTASTATKPPGVSSPSLTFPPSQHPQPSPQQLHSTFPLGNADLTHPSSSDASNHHNHNHNHSFSPPPPSAMFGFSPPAFLTESLPVAPTPPSHPQYATFPFDSSSSNNNNNNSCRINHICRARALHPRIHSSQWQHQIHHRMRSIKTSINHKYRRECSSPPSTWLLSPQAVWIRIPFFLCTIHPPHKHPGCSSPLKCKLRWECR